MAKLLNFSHLVLLVIAAFVFSATMLAAQNYTQINPQAVSVEVGGSGSTGGPSAKGGTVKGSTGKGEGEEKKDPPKSGVLSRTFTSGERGKQVPLPWGQESETDQAPISGSVSKISTNEWRAKVMNNSEEDKYSVSVSVVQFDKLGKQIKRDSFSLVLAPKASAERTVKGSGTTFDAQLNLNSWKKFPNKKKKEDALAVQPPAGAGS